MFCDFNYLFLNLKLKPIFFVNLGNLIRALTSNDGQMKANEEHHHDLDDESDMDDEDIYNNDLLD